ncbi:hypothetical protein KSP39_PZI019742 [Platanthera zijinensis]|uniref:Uncharacterized protein n=1 Tax=Platanthera zijinensis TaxID=2320716 RepID=A0AAP0B109_9ASPA
MARGREPHATARRIPSSSTIFFLPGAASVILLEHPHYPPALEETSTGLGGVVATKLWRCAVRRVAHEVKKQLLPRLENPRLGLSKSQLSARAVIASRKILY